MKFRFAIIVALLIQSGNGAPIELPRPNAVPNGNVQLAAESKELLGRAAALERRSEEHDKKCGKVRAGTAEARECAAQQQKLTADVDAYMADRKKLNQKIKAALASAQSTAERENLFESDDFKQLNATWLRKQHTLIRDAAERDRTARARIATSIKDIQVPPPDLGPQTLNDLLPGDVLLLAPANTLEKAIAIADNVYTGRISESLRSPSSHAIAFLGRDAAGRGLFLNNTTVDVGADPGSHIIGQAEFEQKYGKRGIYVARPIPAVDGRELMRYALDAAKDSKARGRLDSRYGIFGKRDVVCSEDTRFAVARATGVKMTNNRRLVDITPGDFFDSENQAFGIHFTLWGLGNLDKPE